MSNLVPMFYRPSGDVHEVTPGFREFILDKNPEDWKDMAELTSEEKAALNANKKGAKKGAKAFGQNRG